MSERERLLIRIIDLFAERFNKHAVLRGGMVLRVLGCERLTNGVDYVFVPFRSKKDVVEDVLETLGRLDGVQLSHSINSKCLRVIVTADGVTAQVEIKVAESVETDVVSTGSLTKQLGLPPRLVPVLVYSWALADKMAAWNERRLIRDVHDIWFYLRMGVKPDEARLRERLRKPQVSRLVPVNDHFIGEGLLAFYAFLQAKVNTLTDDDIREELADVLPPDEIPGLAMKYKAGIATLAGA